MVSRTDVRAAIKRIKSKRSAKKEISDYEEYNRQLYGEEQWEYIKKHQGGYSQAGYYVAGSGGGSGGSSRAPAAQEPPTRPTVQVRESIESGEEARALTSRRVASPQETVTEEYGISERPVERPRDEIRAGPMGTDAPGISTKEEITKERARSSGGHALKVDLPKEETQSIVSSRIISEQETVSVESEAKMTEERAAGRSIIERPREASLAVSRAIVGYPEYYPKGETAPKGVASAVEWVITLPAETLRTPVSVTELGTEVKERGVLAVATEEVRSVLADPAGAGVKAGLTAGLIIFPAAKVVRGRTYRGAPGRTTGPRYEVKMGPADVRATRIDYISDLTFTHEAKGIRARGTVKVATEGGEAAVGVRSFTEPKGKGFKTTVEADRISRTKMDLIKGDKIRGTIMSKETPAGTKSKGVLLEEEAGVQTFSEGGELVGETGASRQLDVAGQPVSEGELSTRTGISKNVNDVDIAVGQRASMRSELNQRVSRTVDVSGTKLISESRTEKGLRRRTYTREGVVDRAEFERVFLDKDFSQLGITQDTLRRFGIDMPKGTRPPVAQASKDVAIAERSAIQAAMTFQKVRKPTPPETSPRVGAQAQAGAETGRPVSGLGSLQTRPRTDVRVIEEQPEVYRYPPGEGPPKVGEFNASVMDIIQVNQVSNVVRQRQGIRGRSRDLRGQQYRGREGVVLIQEQFLGQRQRQTMAPDMVTRQRQRTRQRIMLPVNPFVRDIRERPFRPVTAKPRGGLGGPPPLPIFSEEPSRVPSDTGRGRFSRKLGYTPSLAGIVSGREISAAPRGAITGLNIKPPVKIRRKK